MKNKTFPIAHWSHSSLIAYLRNPLAWYKRYVEKIYDTPRTPASIIGSAGHKALEHFYGGFSKEQSVALGRAYIDAISDFEINFGVAKTKRERSAKRARLYSEYEKAIGFYLARAPRHKVIAVETSAVAHIDGIPLPVKAVSDLVVESPYQPGALDIVDHKFVDSFSKEGKDKTLFLLQAMFNYYTVREQFNKSIARFVIIECKKTKNADGRSQLKKHTFVYEEESEGFALFHRLLIDATNDIANRTVFLPNPSDMFEGEDSFNLYRLRLSQKE